MRENTKIRCCMLGHALFLIASVGGIVYFVNEILLEENSWNRNYLLVSTFLTLMLLTYCLVRQKQLFNTLGRTLFSAACFLISALVLLVLDFYVNFPAWIIGGILAAALLDRSLGLLYLYFFAFQAIYLQGGSLKGLVLHFLIATIVCIIIPKMKSWLSMLYMMVVVGCLVVIASFVMNHMEFKQDMVLEALPILGIYIGCIFVAMLLRMWNIAAENTLLRTENTAVPQTAEELSAGEDYTAYCNESSELLLQLKKHSESAYLHSEFVAEMAGEAAKKVQANASLVRAAALHHEIGRLRGGTVAEQTLALLEEQEFPKEVLELLAACENKEDFTLWTKEAVLLLLADKIAAMYHFLRKAGKQTPPAKMVDRIITMQLMHGEWNASGLSIADCTMLRNYFIEQLTEQDKKRGEKA